MFEHLLVCLLMAGTAAAREPTLALPPGTDVRGWESASSIAQLTVAASTAQADLHCRQAGDVWELFIVDGATERVLARVAPPASQREREELALLAASLMMDLGLWYDEPVVEPGSPPQGTEVPLVESSTDAALLAGPRAAMADEAGPAPKAPPKSVLGEVNGSVGEPSSTTSPGTTRSTPDTTRSTPDTSGLGVPQERLPPPPAQPAGNASQPNEPHDTTPDPAPDDKEQPIDLNALATVELPAGDPPPPGEPPAATPVPSPTGSSGRVDEEPLEPRAFWISTGTGLSLWEELRPSVLVRASGGVVLHETWWLGVRAGWVSPRGIAALDHQEQVSAREVGVLLRWCPEDQQVAPSVDAALDNSWRRYSQSSDEPTRHSVLTTSTRAGLAFHRETWSLLGAVGLAWDLDHTVLRMGAEQESSLTRLHGEAWLELTWHPKKK